MIKRILTTALALCLLAGVLAGCGKKKDAAGDDSSPVSEASQLVPTPTPSPSPARTAKAAKITSDVGLNVRSEPSTDSDDNILALADEGDLLPLLVEKPSDGWYQVEYQGKTAYISADYATVVEVTLEEYNQLKAAASKAESAPESDAPTPTPSPRSDDPANKGVLTPPVDQQESSSSAEDGE